MANISRSAIPSVSASMCCWWMIFHYNFARKWMMSTTAICGAPPGRRTANIFMPAAHSRAVVRIRCGAGRMADADNRKMSLRLPPRASPISRRAPKAASISPVRNRRLAPLTRIILGYSNGAPTPPIFAIWAAISEFPPMGPRSISTLRPKKAGQRCSRSRNAHSYSIHRRQAKISPRPFWIHRPWLSPTGKAAMHRP